MENDNCNIALTVIVPCYIAAKTLHITADSFDRQWPTRDDYEIIMVNDASPDATLDAINAYAARNPHVLVIDLPTNGGPGAARNAALDVAQGTWVTFVDAGDALIDGTLEKMLTLAEQQADNIDAIKFNCATIDIQQYTPADTAVDVPLPEPKYYNDKGILTALQCCMTIFKRENIEKIGLRLPTIRLAEDRFFNTLYFSAFPRLCFYDAPLYLYILTPGSLTDANSNAKCQAMVEGHIKCMAMTHDAYLAGKVNNDMRLHVNAMTIKDLFQPLVFAGYNLRQLKTLRQRLNDIDALTIKFGAKGEKLRVYLLRHPLTLRVLMPLLRLTQSRRLAPNHPQKPDNK